MKKFSVLCLVITFIALSHVHAAAYDSLVGRRNDLYYQYLDIRNNTKYFLMTDCVKLNEILEQIVLSDNQLLDTLAAHDKQYAGNYGNMLSDGSEMDQITNELDNAKFSNNILMISAAGAGLLFLIFFILFLSKLSAISKVKKKMTAELAEIKNKYNELSGSLSSKETDAADPEALRNAFRAEMETMETRLRDKEAELAGLRNEMAGSSRSYESQLQESRSRIASLESETARLQRRLDEKGPQADDTYRISELKTELENFRRMLGHLESTVVERDKRIGELLGELDAIKELAKDRKHEAGEAAAKPFTEEQYQKELAGTDIVAAKIERLEALRSKNMLSEEEFRALRQKFLKEFK